MLMRCTCCGRETHASMLDGKPKHLAGPGNWLERLFPKIRTWRLNRAGDRGDDFDLAECWVCYGPGWNPNNY